MSRGYREVYLYANSVQGTDIYCITNNYCLFSFCDPVKKIKSKDKQHGVTQLHLGPICIEIHLNEIAQSHNLEI